MGATVCRFHQGKGVVRAFSDKKRQVTVELSLARRALAKLNVNAEEYELKDPRVVLLQTVTVSHTMVEALTEMIRALQVEDIAAIGELPVPGMGYTARGARAEAYMRLLGEWTDRTARAAKMALDAGLDERLVALAEKQGDMMVAAVRAAVFRVGLADALSAPLLEALAEELRLLATPRIVVPETPAETARLGRTGLPLETARIPRNVTPQEAVHSTSKSQKP